MHLKSIARAFMPVIHAFTANSICALLLSSSSAIHPTIENCIVYNNICYNKPNTHIHTELMCQSKGLSMSVLRQRCQDDKQDIWDCKCSCDWGMAGDAWVTNTFRGVRSLLESRVTSDSPHGRHENGLERQRGLAPAGRVTRALWLLPWLCSTRVCGAWETGQGHHDCLAGSALPGREDSPRIPM